jgi:hypothetical protein
MEFTQYTLFFSREQRENRKNKVFDGKFPHSNPILTADRNVSDSLPSLLTFRY